MTEQTLGKAIKIKQQIDGLRGRKAEAKKVQALCKKVEGENMIFRIQVQNSGCYREGITISAQTAQRILDNEIEAVEMELKILLNELSELH